MRTILFLIPIVTAIGALAFRNRTGIRISAVVVIVASGLSLSGALIAPHRVAEEFVHQSPQTEEWRRGARDTRDAVYQALPILAAAFVGLAALALVPVSKK